MFRFLVSKACPNKVVLAKGDVQISSGQHYAIIDGKEVRTRDNSEIASGVDHPQRCDYMWEFTQVHHFKWDESLKKRLEQIVEIDEKYTYGWEYKLLIDYFEYHGGNINVNDKNFKLQDVNVLPKYLSWDYIRDVSLRF